MAKVQIPLYRFVLILVVSTILLYPRPATAQCVGIAEEGRWRNLDDKGEPTYVDIKELGGCGDESDNGNIQGGGSHYSVRVWVRQDTGKFFGRPTLNGFYRAWKGKQWLRANVTTGGYQDQMWMVVDQHEGKTQLHVMIRHQSLDIKPSAQSEYWFVKTPR
jgi:hypothetical protein